MPPWQAQRAKIQLKLSIQRLELVQKKKEAIAKQTRRDIADLLAKGKLETAKIRTEVIIADEITIELLELLSLYAELLLARFALLDNPAATTEPDPGVKEAVCSIMYAAPRTEVRELQVLRDILMHKYSRDFAVATMSNEHGNVNERVVKKLEIFRPPPELIDGYLDAISAHYKVGWTSGREQIADGVVPSADFEDGPSDEAAAAQATTAGDEKAALTTAATDTPNPSASTTTSAPAPPSYDVAKEKPLTDDQLLAARFEALKKRYDTTPVRPTPERPIGFRTPVANVENPPSHRRRPSKTLILAIVAIPVVAAAVLASPLSLGLVEGFVRGLHTAGSSSDP